MADTNKKEETAIDVADDIEEVEDAGGDAGDSKTLESAVIASQLMQNPEVLAALQDRLGGMVGTASGYIQSLPKVVKRRIKALKKLQFEMTKIEAKFYEEVHALECKYATQYAPFMERRKDIVTGGTEPTDSDAEWPSDDEEEDEKAEADKLADDLKDKAAIEDKKEDGEEENPTGIPSFWLTVFKNVDMLAEMVQEHDEPVLNHLQDIKVKFTESDPMGFTLDFHFDSNEYFTNTVLTKQYIMRSEPDEADPFSFEGPEIIKCKGCSIDWKKGKNVTVKLIKKTQKHKGRGTKRTVTKTVQNDSFFNFFAPPEAPEGEDEVDEDTEALLAADFEIGHFIRERIVPRAVLYFTGEALDEDEYEEEGEEEEEDDNDDIDEDNDPDYVPPQGDPAKPAECKQQ
ncbi:unnamed protein product [Owenia fusiformis]|uniref:Nucleosome assembly protein 1-like 1 n=1 Tax=Owenia fusiformis TaxID=6347 RepID=A0A8S4P3E8_OWEFU|nr:unnamed protein product [Owenia fusiformis]